MEGGGGGGERIRQNPENNIGQFRHNIVSVAQSNHKFPKTKMQKIIKIFAQKSYTSAKTRKYFRFEKSAKIVVEKSAMYL